MVCDNCLYKFKYVTGESYCYICSNMESEYHSCSVIGIDYALKKRFGEFVTCSFFKDESEYEAENETEENINHPDRYKRHNMECIDEMVEVFGIEAVIGFCKCNAWKYRYRVTCEEDQKKADWYLVKLKELNGLLEVQQHG